MSCAFYHDDTRGEIMKDIYRTKETAEKYRHDKESGLLKSLWDEEVIY